MEEQRISDILNKYCKFLPVEVKFGKKKIFVDDPKGVKDENDKVKQIEKEVDNIVNNTTPTWTKTPQDLNEEDYSAFTKSCTLLSLTIPFLTYI